MKEGGGEPRREHQLFDWGAGVQKKSLDEGGTTPPNPPTMGNPGLRKFVLVNELFVLRQYFMRHLTAKSQQKIL